MDNHQPTTTNTEDAIRIQAYLLSEKAGHPAGMEAAFWAEAERLVNGRRSPNGAKPGPARKKSTAAPKPPSPKAASPEGRKVGRKPSSAAKVDAPQPEAAPAEARKPRSRKVVATNVNPPTVSAKSDAKETPAPAGDPKPAKTTTRRGKKSTPPPEADSLFPSARP